MQKYLENYYKNEHIYQLQKGLVYSFSGKYEALFFKPEALSGANLQSYRTYYKLQFCT